MMEITKFVEKHCCVAKAGLLGCREGSDITSASFAVLGNMQKQDTNKLVVWTASQIMGTAQVTVSDLYRNIMCRKMCLIFGNGGHPLHAKVCNMSRWGSDRLLEHKIHTRGCGDFCIPAAKRF